MTKTDKISELQEYILFQGFSTEELEILADKIELKHFSKEEFLFHENETSKEVYLIRSGAVKVFREDQNKQLEELFSAGQIIGELAMLDGAPRSATVICTEDTETFILDVSTLPLTLTLLNRLNVNIALVTAQKLRQQRFQEDHSNDIEIPITIKDLRRFEMLENLTDQELIILAEVLETRKLQPKEYLFYENDSSYEIYFIQSGAFDIIKKDASGDDQIIATLKEGKEVGELAFSDGAPRSASVRAKEESEVFILNINHLPSNLVLLNRLATHITEMSSQHVRQTNVEHVETLKRELKSEQLRNDFSKFFIYILSVFSIGTLVNYFLHTYLQSIDVYGELFKWGYLLVLFIPTAFVIWKMKIPLVDLGLTLKGWKKSLKEGVVVSLVFGIVLYVVFTLIVQPLLHLPTKHVEYQFWGSIGYIIHSALQELLARGVLQSSFRRFFNDTKGTNSVLLTAALFGLFHIHFGLFAVLATMLTSVLFGFLYLRHQNLIGVTIFHTVSGICAFSLGVL